MSIDFTVEDIVPASPQAIYEAWLNSERHSAMTGSPAHMSADLNGSFTAQDNYISGRNLVLEPYRRIVQTWRTTKFAADDPDSQIEVVLEPLDGGTSTRVVIHHSQVPDGHTTYQDSWQSHYFSPMKAYFSSR